MKKIILSVFAVFILSTSAYALEDAYYLFDRDGIVCVFENPDSTEPTFSTEIVVKTLPLSDQEHLKTGIPVTNKESLLRMLEDFGS